MLELFEKAAFMWSSEFFDNNKKIRYKTKLLNPLVVGKRKVLLYDEIGDVVGEFIEDAGTSVFLRRFYVNGEEVAQLEGDSFRGELTLHCVDYPMAINREDSSLCYWVANDSGDMIFSYQKRIFRKSKLHIFDEERTVVCILIAVAVAMDCNTDYSGID